jgi:hypothetical protein
MTLRRSCFVSGGELREITGRGGVIAFTKVALLLQELTFSDEEYAELRHAKKLRDNHRLGRGGGVGVGEGAAFEMGICCDRHWAATGSRRHRRHSPSIPPRNHAIQRHCRPTVSDENNRQCCASTAFHNLNCLAGKER